MESVGEGIAFDARAKPNTSDNINTNILVWVLYDT